MRDGLAVKCVEVGGMTVVLYLEGSGVTSYRTFGRAGIVMTHTAPNWIGKISHTQEGDG